MATFSYTTGKTALYLFPYDDALSLASWATYRILATEAASPNQGRYSFTPNALYDVYYLFDGASQPANWNAAVEIIDITDEFDPTPNHPCKLSEHWTPEGLTNGSYVFDLDPRYVYSNAAGTTRATVGSTARSIKCRNADILLVLSANCDYKRDNWGGYYITIPADNTYATITGMTLSDDDVFMSIAMEKTTSNHTALIAPSTNSNGSTSWYIGANQPAVFGAWAGSDFSASAYDYLTLKSNVWSGHYDNATATVYQGLNVATSAKINSAAVFNQTIGLFKYVSTNTSPTPGKFRSLVFAKGATSVEERERCILWNARHNNYPVVICDGNSLTYGTGSTGGNGSATAYPGVLNTSLATRYGSGNVAVFNIGVGGQSDADMLTRYDAYVGSGIGSNVKVLCVWGVTNSLASGSYTPRQTIDTLWTYCTKARQHGWKIVLFDCINRNESGLIANFKTLQEEANRILRREACLFVDYFDPISESVELSNPNSTSYFNADKVHLNDSGYSFVASRALRGVRFCFDQIPNQAAYDATLQIMTDALPTLAEMEAAGSITITTFQPVSESGSLPSPIIIGDDYLDANGRAFEWTVDEITAVDPTTATCEFGGEYKTYEWLVTGTITDNLDGTWTLSFDLNKTTTGALVDGWYDWTVQITDVNAKEITVVQGAEKVEVRSKQT